jgi:hypothetical protein
MVPRTEVCFDRSIFESEGPRDRPELVSDKLPTSCGHYIILRTSSGLPMRTHNLLTHLEPERAACNNDGGEVQPSYSWLSRLDNLAECHIIVRLKRVEIAGY